MKDRGLIIAAAILVAGMIASVLLYESAENARIARREHQAECRENREALDRCLAARRGTADAAELDLRITNQCREFWTPVIGEACKPD